MPQPTTAGREHSPRQERSVPSRAACQLLLNSPTHLVSGLSIRRGANGERAAELSLSRQTAESLATRVRSARPSRDHREDRLRPGATLALAWHSERLFNLCERSFYNTHWTRGVTRRIRANERGRPSRDEPQMNGYETAGNRPEKLKCCIRKKEKSAESTTCSNRRYAYCLHCILVRVSGDGRICEKQSGKRAKYKSVSWLCNASRLSPSIPPFL